MQRNQKTGDEEQNWQRSQQNNFCLPVREDKKIWQVVFYKGGQDNYIPQIHFLVPSIEGDKEMYLLPPFVRQEKFFFFPYGGT